MNSDSSRAAFLELYVALTRVLSTRKGSRFPELKVVCTEARKLHGEHLTALIVQWYGDTSPISDRVAASDESVLATRPCFTKLCIERIFANVSFSSSSRANLWMYLQGLVLHAKECCASGDVGGGESKSVDDEIPPPTGGIDFGSGTEAQLKAVQELTSALPPQVMTKMHMLAQNYQQELADGKRDVSEMSFSKILQDVVGSLNSEDILSFVGNMDGVIKTMQKSQALPEVQALMRSMRQAGVSSPVAG